MSDIVTVDDEDTQVRLSGMWNPYSPPNDGNVWMGTISEATEAGPSAWFTFTGSQVSVYGRVEPAANNSQQPLSLYSVGPQQLQAFIPASVTTAQDNVLFFNSSVMEYGQYTLIINVTRASTDAPYMLDSIRYNTSSTSLGPSGNGPSNNGSSSSSGPSSSGSSSSSSSSVSHPIGAIVGGVVGGLALVTIAFVLFLCCRRRRRARGRVGSSEDIPGSKITPYPVGTPEPTLMSPYSDLPPVSLAGTPLSMTHTGSLYSLPTPTSSNKAAMARAGSFDPRHFGGTEPSAYTSSEAAHDAALVGRLPSSTADSSSGSGSSMPPHTHRSATPLSRKAVEGAGLTPAADDGPRDSGARFPTGATPSNVAPVLPTPIRSMPTRSEVADVPPAYTQD